MSISITPGQKIRLARLARGLSLRQLAEKLNYTYGWLDQIEKGQISIKVNQYEAIQAALGYNFNTPEADAAFAFFLGGTTNA